MLKPLAISIAVCLGFASCQVFQKSETWQTVMSVRPGDSIREPDPSASYAEKLHQVLLERGVEHIVVAYQYHYYSNHYDEAVGTRTAVVYRDPVNSGYPWWLKDDRLGTPFWLPNGELSEQVSFYAKRPVEILEKHVYPAGGRSGKACTAMLRPPPAALRTADLQKPQPVTQVAQIKTAPAAKAKPVATTGPAAAKSTASAPMAPVTKIQQPPPALASARAKPVNSPAPAPVAAAPLNSFWSPPVTIDPAEEASVSHSERLEKLFRLHNGTAYDRSSAMDRRKMQQLKQSLTERESVGERGLLQGVDGEETRIR